MIGVVEERSEIPPALIPYGTTFHCRAIVANRLVGMARFPRRCRPSRESLKTGWIRRRLGKDFRGEAQRQHEDSTKGCAPGEGETANLAHWHGDDHPLSIWQRW